tara:strand:+ start:5362 stop:5589 length:228 start_codon:yes stop_codon:yes gene_type:complete
MTFHNENQKKIYEAIKDFIDEKGFSPRYKDISEKTGLGIKPIQSHVVKLEERGLLIRPKGRQGIELTSTQSEAHQ